MDAKNQAHVQVLREIVMDFFSDDVLGQFGPEKAAIEAAIRALAQELPDMFNTQQEMDVSVEFSPTTERAAYRRGFRNGVDASAAKRSVQTITMHRGDEITLRRAGGWSEHRVVWNARPPLASTQPDDAAADRAWAAYNRRQDELDAAENMPLVDRMIECMKAALSTITQPEQVVDAAMLSRARKWDIFHALDDTNMSALLESVLQARTPG